MKCIKQYFPDSLRGFLRGQIDREGLSKRRRKGGKKKKKKHSKMKGQQKKRGNYCSFLMEMVMKWDMGLGTIEGHRQVERHRVNCFLLGSHLALTFTD